MESATVSRSALYTDVGSRIRDQRQRRKVSQETLADLVGLTRTSIVNIEKGRHQVLLHTLLQIAEALDTKPTRLIPDLSKFSRLNLPEGLPPSVTRWITRSVEEAK
jgi:transcriptional regulator with XRE-family HTH domain